MTLQEYLATTTQAAFAKRIGRSQGMVGHYLSGRVQIPAEMAVTIERVTEGQVTRSELRHDLWPPSPAESAEERAA